MTESDLEVAPGRYARVVVVARWWVLAGVLLGTLLAVRLAPSASLGLGGGLYGSLPASSPALRAQALSAQRFAFPLLPEAVVVQHDVTGLSPFVQARAVLHAITLDRSTLTRSNRGVLLGALPLVNDGPLHGKGRPGSTIATWLFTNPNHSLVAQSSAVRSWVEANVQGPGDSLIGVTGTVPALATEQQTILGWLRWLTLASLAAIVLVCALTYRSALAAALPLVVAGVAYLLSRAGLAVLTHSFGLPVPGDLQPLLIVVLLGMSTDYSVFFLSAFQRLRRAGASSRDAAQLATAQVAPIVLAAGLTVAAATAGLEAARFQLFRSLGPGLVVTVLTTALVAVLLAPAVLAVAGRVLVHRGPALERRRAVVQRSRALVRKLLRRPVALLIVLGVSAMLVIAASPATGIQLGLPLFQGLPAGGSSQRASEAAAEGFPAGVVSPTLVVLTGLRSADQPGLTRLQDLLGRQPGVGAVVGPANLPAAVHASAAALGAFGVFLSKRGGVARLLVVLDVPPLTKPALADVARLETRLPGLLRRAGLSRVSALVGGDTALADELVRATRADVVPIALAVAALDLMVLIVALRALVAPMLLVLLGGATVAVSLGVVDEVIRLLGWGSFTFYVPVAAGVLLVALGSDYGVFSVGRIWEEARHAGLRGALVRVTADNARVLRVAGLILTASFAMLAVIPLRSMREMAMVLAVGMVIDTMVVRPLLLPAALALLGRASGWPGYWIQGSERS